MEDSFKCFVNNNKKNYHVSMKRRNENTPEGMGFIEKGMELLEKYGFIKLAKLGLVFLIGSYMFWLGTNQDKVLERVLDKKNIEHARMIEHRKKVEPQVKLYLKQLLLETNSDRAFVLEMHNGTNNPSGLPFQYAEMTYEEVTDGTQHIDEDYRSLNLSRFDFPTYLHKKKIWIGSIEELALVDERLAQRLKNNDVTYAGFVLLRDDESELGFLGVTCLKGHEHNENDIIESLVDKSQQISSKLSAKNIK